MDIDDELGHLSQNFFENEDLKEAPGRPTGNIFQLENNSSNSETCFSTTYNSICRKDCPNGQNESDCSDEENHEMDWKNILGITGVRKVVASPEEKMRIRLHKLEKSILQLQNNESVSFSSKHENNSFVGHYSGINESFTVVPPQTHWGRTFKIVLASFIGLLLLNFIFKKIYIKE